MNKKNILIIGLIGLAVLSRIIPHPVNFTPIIAIAMFGATYLGRKMWMFLIPIVAFWFSDVVLNNTIYAGYFEGFTLFHKGLIATFIALGLIVLISIPLLRKVNLKSILGTGLLGSVLFFLVSNFAVWLSGFMYPMNFEGLMACYVAAVPFFLNTLMGTLVYSGLLFGIYEWMISRNVALKTSKVGL